MAGTRVALRRPRALRQAASSSPVTEAEEIAQRGMCREAESDRATSSASSPVKRQASTARESAPGLRRKRFITPLVTTSSASSMIAAWAPKQKAASTGMSLSIPGTGASSET